MLETVMVYNSLVEAKMAQELLANHGLQSFVADEHMGSFFPLGMGGFRLQVSQIDLEKAKVVLGVES